MVDRIVLKDMAFYGYHGVLQEERQRGQVFFVDVEVECDLHSAGHSDDLRYTVDYREVYRRVQAVLLGPPKALVEALAEEVAHRLLEMDRVEAVTVEVRKPHVDLGGPVGHAAVRVHRRRGPRVGPSAV
ncbi:MAG: dihydroneopterin aldolase [Armatimonadota bacterium]|nr:dihydroneopterin aldolase [Armatimonadota bacterium]MDW8155165.1 dihydroneopterin aldolase [Armatimonadota bacterium]